MFDLEKNANAGTFREPSREEMRAHRQKEYNKRQKTLVKVVAENLASYACVLIFVLLIGFIWTDIGIFVDVTSFLTDAVVTVVLFVLGEICMSSVGKTGGRLDDDYIRVRAEYLEVRDRVRKMGTLMMDVFCDWQIDVEYETYVRKQCKALKIDRERFLSEYKEMNLAELGKIFPPDLALRVFNLGQVKRIELTPDMLLTDGRTRGERGGIPESGEEYVTKHTTGWQHLLTTAAFGIVAAVPVFTLTQDVSMGRVIYTIFKMAMLSYRMYQGYGRGALGFNTVEPRHLQAKLRYLYEYIEFIEQKTYLSLGDEYIGGIPYDQDQRKEQVDESI